MMTTHAEVLPTYRWFRQLGLQLNHKLVGTLSKEDFHEGGRRLGMLKNGILVFDSEDETSVLMDFCIHNVRIGGRNAVQRYLAESPAPAGSDEMVLLTAMLNGYYSLFEAIEAENGVGVTVLDLLRDETQFIADIGFSSTVRNGDVLATRVFPLEEQGFVMSGGAGLPVTAPALARIRKELSREFAPNTDFARLTPDQESDLAARTIRVCLASGMSSRIAYGTSAEAPSRKERGIDPREVRLANRNDPCPCGSGRKFKSCCGRRPRR
jgi:hypothetical protein